MIFSINMISYRNTLRLFVKKHGASENHENHKNQMNQGSDNCLLFQSVLLPTENCKLPTLQNASKHRRKNPVISLLLAVRLRREQSGFFLSNWNVEKCQV